MDNSATVPSTAQQAENKGSERVFTQDEVNNIVQERLARERSKSAERTDDLTAREADLKAREEALAAKTKEFDAWTAKEACRAYLHDNKISEKLLDKLDTSDPEAFKKAVQTVQNATDNSFTLAEPKTTIRGADVPNPPVWLSEGENGCDSKQIKRAFGLND